MKNLPRESEYLRTSVLQYQKCANELEESEASLPDMTNKENGNLIDSYGAEKTTLGVLMNGGKKVSKRFEKPKSVVLVTTRVAVAKS